MARTPRQTHSLTPPRSRARAAPPAQTKRVPKRNAAFGDYVLSVRRGAGDARINNGRGRGSPGRPFGFLAMSCGQN
jgi:hypothetical protein